MRSNRSSGALLLRIHRAFMWSNRSNGALLLLVLGLAPGTSEAWYSGTPAGVPPSFDCAARGLAYTYGRQLAPHRGQFKSLYDALQVGVSAM